MAAGADGLPDGADGVPDEVETLLRESPIPLGVPGARGAAWANRIVRTAIVQRRTSFDGDPELLIRRLMAGLGGYARYAPEPGIDLRLLLRDERGNAVVLDTLFSAAAARGAGEVLIRGYAERFLLGRHPERSFVERAIALVEQPAPPAAPPVPPAGPPAPPAAPPGAADPGPIVTVDDGGAGSINGPRPDWVTTDVVTVPEHLRPVDFAAAFTSPTALVDGAPVAIAVHRLSPLVLTGGLVVCDPFALRWAPSALTAAVPVGRFAVFAATVTTGRGHRMVAAAVVRFAVDPVARWVLATTPGQDLATLGPDEVFGFGVDTGTACFADAATAAALLAAAGVVDVESWRGLPASMADRPAEARRLIDSVGAAFDRFDPALVEASDSWGEVMGSVISPARGPGTIVIVGSGGGDGVYAGWLGYSTDGRLAAVAIDFDLLDTD